MASLAWTIQDLSDLHTTYKLYKHLLARNFRRAQLTFLVWNKFSSKESKELSCNVIHRRIIICFSFKKARGGANAYAVTPVIVYPRVVILSEDCHWPKKCQWRERCGVLAQPHSQPGIQIPLLAITKSIQASSKPRKPRQHVNHVTSSIEKTNTSFDDDIRKSRGSSGRLSSRNTRNIRKS